MSEHEELRRLAERVIKNRGPLPWGKRQMDFQKAASPQTILSLLDEIEGLRDEIEGLRRFRAVMEGRDFMEGQEP